MTQRPTVTHQGHERQEQDGKIVSDDVSKQLVQLFKLLSDETRLRILFYLRQQEELHVRALCDLLKQSQPAVSHHLALLRVAGLIEARRDGKHNFYHLLPKRFAELTGLFFSAMPQSDDLSTAKP
ncbi:MAG: metalloregulator ArsR/SmtB family transcription factor [Planctomycetes bacterium]|nr:metalloregulator ArsR/SmtB family transcription factor [Planctomycetota bacterium]